LLLGSHDNNTFEKYFSSRQNQKHQADRRLTGDNPALGRAFFRCNRARTSGGTAVAQRDSIILLVVTSMKLGEIKMTEMKDKRVTGAAMLIAIAAVVAFAVRLKTSTIEPGAMFFFGAALIILRLLISHCFNRMTQLPVKTR
jgi:cation transport ATPase